jgi:hypothetical protein
MTKILLGADPELFMRNPNTGAFVSAHGAVPGTKREPFKVPYGAIQIDGTALEFNIDPASTVDEFVHNLTSVRSQIAAYVPGYNVVAEPVAIYDKDYFDWDVPGPAKELGCDPDYNGWTNMTNPRPEPGNKPMRTAAGHIHIGWTEGQDVFDKSHFELCSLVSRQLDYYLGIYSLLWDKDGTRRELYGRAGAFRPKPYGVEYRVLSNSWLNSETLMRWVYNQAVLGVQSALDGNVAEKAWGDTAMNIINSNLTNWQDVYPIHYGVGLVLDKEAA